MNRRHLHTLVLATATAVFAVSSTAGSKTDLQQKAEELAKLRSEVDLLDAEVRAERTQGQAMLKTLEARRTALSTNLDAERVRAKAARTKLEGLRQTIEQRKGASQVLLPLFDKAADHLAAAAREGLPFHREERLAAIDELKVKARTGRIDPETACVRLWQLVEDEIRLTGETVRTKVPLSLDIDGKGPRQLADVVRIGMVTMFVRHAPHSFSRIVRRDGSWRSERIQNGKQITQLEGLFEAVGKQVFQGDYVLPLPSLEGPKA